MRYAPFSLTAITDAVARVIVAAIALGGIRTRIEQSIAIASVPIVCGAT
jgi:hypothetical protein